MPLYEIVKADGTREKVEACYAINSRGFMRVCNHFGTAIKEYAPGTWLEVWRREGVGE